MLNLDPYPQFQLQLQHQLEIQHIRSLTSTLSLTFNLNFTHQGVCEGPNLFG